MDHSEKISRDDFLMKEYDTLHNEMNENVREVRTVERNSMIATGVIWSWLATGTATAAYKQVKWLPAILVLFSAYRAFGLTSHINRIRTYLKKIENYFLLQNDWGFEQLYYSKLTSRRMSAYVFWILLFLLTLIVPALFGKSVNEIKDCLTK